MDAAFLPFKKAFKNDNQIEGFSAVVSLPYTPRARYTPGQTCESWAIWAWNRR